MAFADYFPRPFQVDERNQEQLGDMVGVLQDSVEIDDEMKSKLKDACCSVSELSANRETHLRQLLLVRDKYLSRCVELLSSLNVFAQFLILGFKLCKYGFLCNVG